MRISFSWSCKLACQIAEIWNPVSYMDFTTIAKLTEGVYHLLKSTMALTKIVLIGAQKRYRWFLNHLWRLTLADGIEVEADAMIERLFCQPAIFAPI